MEEQLKAHRAAIDALDAEILRLISARAGHAQAIGALKKGVIYRPEREAQVLRRIKELNPGPLAGDAVARLFREIMSACLALEQPLSVGFLGPVGTFTQAAVIKHFGHAARAEACTSIDEVFRKVESGALNYGVVPVENSTEGVVGRTLDLIMQSPLQICGEVELRIHQNLLRKVAGLDGVQKVVSHAQSLAQCHEWLNANLPNVPREAVSSNAEAARLASGDASLVALAGETAAEIYQLNVLAANIEDEPNNSTRFWVLGQHDANSSGTDRTSIVVAAKNRPGAIVELLQPLAASNVSMSKLESRPARSGLWEYVFFVDLDGHRNDEKVAHALQAVEVRASFMKILGSYPVAVL